ncbi:MAG: tetraacyldisaccharide 4'-kinase, partial [Thiobacillus sp.]|nr:tetraacyldisaccharide 4'-kinase [Thiobacillus sp.]
EPVRRLREVDAVAQVVRDGAVRRLPAGIAGWRVDTSPGRAYRLRRPQEKCLLAELPRLHWLAVAGIGRPQGFFDMLTRAGLDFEPHAYPDHHDYRPGELPEDRPLLMTEKDAVKCFSFAGADWWAVELDLAPETGFAHWLDAHIPTTARPV